MNNIGIFFIFYHDQSCLPSDKFVIPCLFSRNAENTYGWVSYHIRPSAPCDRALIHTYLLRENKQGITNDHISIVSVWKDTNAHDHGNLQTLLMTRLRRRSGKRSNFYTKYHKKMPQQLASMKLSCGVVWHICKVLAWGAVGSRFKPRQGQGIL